MMGLLVLATFAAAGAGADPYASIADLRAAYAAGRTTAEAAVAGDLQRIESLDRAGPRLNSVIAINPRAPAEARAADAARRAGRPSGSLAGIPVLLKDNIESADGLATTAGSLALAANVTLRDAPIVGRLKAAGAIVLGKANLSEWANFRASRSISGWSAVGGLTRNPYILDRTTCGSSSGSAVAVAAGFAAAAIGTETDGSITCPAATVGLVGYKPTLGLVSRRLVAPISPEQDTPGPIARNVADAAAVLSVIAGSDPQDPATTAADRFRADYLAALRPDALKGVRIGVLRGQVRGPAGLDAVFDHALQTLQAAGAVLVEAPPPPKADMDALKAAESLALKSEFRAALAAYLAQAAPNVAVRDLPQLIAFNGRTPAELALFGQDTFVEAAQSPPLDDPAYLEARATAGRLARAALDRMFADLEVAAVVAETNAPAPVIDLVNGAPSLGSPSTLPAVAGYPHLTVPMGQVGGLPVGLSMIGPAWTDARILAFGYAFEAAVGVRNRPGFLPTAAAVANLSRALDP